MNKFIRLTPDTMLLFLKSILFSLVYISMAVSSNPAKSCSRALEKIIFKPNSCALKYFQGLEAQFYAFGGKTAVFGPEKDTFLFSFVKTFDISLELVDAFGLTIAYEKDGTTSIEPPAKYPNTAQTYLNQSGFVRQTSNKTFYYSFPLFSDKGEYYKITFHMPLDKDPIFC